MNYHVIFIKVLKVFFNVNNALCKVYVYETQNKLLVVKIPIRKMYSNSWKLKRH